MTFENTCCIVGGVSWLEFLALSPAINVHTSTRTLVMSIDCHANKLLVGLL